MDLKKIGSIIAVIAVWLMLGSFGLASDGESSQMVPVWLGIFAVIFAAVFIYEKKRSREYTAETPKALLLAKKVVGIALIIGSVAAPSYMFKDAGFSAGIHVLIIVLSAILVVIGGVAVNILNSTKGKNVGLSVIGYLLLIGISTVPGFAMMQHDSGYNALGMSYYAAVAVAILAWLGSSITFTKE